MRVLVEPYDLSSVQSCRCDPAVRNPKSVLYQHIHAAMAWYEQLDLDFGNITDQFTDLIGEVLAIQVVHLLPNLTVHLLRTFTGVNTARECQQPGDSQSRCHGYSRRTRGGASCR